MPNCVTCLRGLCSCGLSGIGCANYYSKEGSTGHWTHFQHRQIIHKPFFINRVEQFRTVKAMEEPQLQSTFQQNILNFPPDSKEEFDITHAELDQIKEAMKDEKFRKLLNDYVEEVRDPINQLTYQTEMRQLEKERGNIVHFINPVAGYVLKTSVDGKMKAFINVCSNPLIKKPSFETVTQGDKTGSMWSIPYSQSPGRDDMDKSRNSCRVYDVIFNAEALRMAKQNKLLQEKLEETALDAVEKSFSVVLDRKNVRKPKLRYKGMKMAATIKYKIGGSPPECININELGKELAPQADEVVGPKKEQSKPKDTKTSSNAIGGSGDKSENSQPPESHVAPNLDNDATVPTYNLRYRSYVDMQDYSLESQKQGQGTKPIPDEVILTIDLPLLRNSSSLDADVLENGWFFELKSDKAALYKLKLKLPFQVHQEASKAVFDKDKRKLSITMKTVQRAPQFLFPTPEPGEQIVENVEEEELFKKPKPVKKLDSVESINLDIMTLSDSPPEESSSLGSSCSPNAKKSVSFSDVVQRQLYRSNSSILGQRKKNQRKAKNKKKSRERLNSGESVSSMDDDDNGRATRTRICSGESMSSMDDENDTMGLDDEDENVDDCIVNDVLLE